MKKTAEQIIQSFDGTLAEKRKWEYLYKDVYKYMMPSREFDKTTGFDAHEEIYSSVGEQSADKFVQRVQSILTPVGMDWINFEAGYMIDKQVEDTTPINKELAKVAEICNIMKNTSNFDTVATEFYYDLIAGTSCLLVLEGTKNSPLRFVAVPMKEFSIEEGIFGEVGAVYRAFKIKRSLVKKQWRDARFEVDDDDVKGSPCETIDLIESCYVDYDYDLWHYTVIERATQKIIVDRTYKSNPFIILRWTKCAGEVYGRGLGLKSIKDVKTLNLITEYSLRALAFTIPVFLAQQDAAYSPEDFTLKPGAINMVPSTSTANPSITQLGVNVTHDITAYATEKMTMDIKKNMMDTTLPDDPKRGLTATEIEERARELQGNLNNSFGRILNEFMYPLAKRIIEVLQSFGYIDRSLDVRSFNGFGYKIVITTALANQQSQTEIAQIVNALQLLFSFDPSGQLGNKVVDIEGLTPYLMEKMGVNKKFLRSKDEIIAMQQQSAQATADMADAESARQIEVATQIEQGKAEAKRRYG